MNEFSEIVMCCESVVRSSNHVSMRDQTHKRILRLRDAIDKYIDAPPDLGIHVVDGVKPEMKVGE